MRSGTRKRKGFMIVEICISVALFSVGVLAVFGAIAYSGRTITDSRLALAEETGILSDVEDDSMTLLMEPDENISGVPMDNVSMQLEPQTGDGSYLTVPMRVYRYEKESGKGLASFYMLKRRN